MEGSSRVGGTRVRGQEWPPFKLKLLISTGDNILLLKVTVQALGCQKAQSRGREEKRGKDQREGEEYKPWGQLTLSAVLFKIALGDCMRAIMLCTTLLIFPRVGPGTYCAVYIQKIIAFLPYNTT